MAKLLTVAFRHELVSSNMHALGISTLEIMALFSSASSRAAAPGPLSSCFSLYLMILPFCHLTGYQIFKRTKQHLLLYRLRKMGIQACL